MAKICDERTEMIKIAEEVSGLTHILYGACSIGSYTCLCGKRSAFSLTDLEIGTVKCPNCSTTHGIKEWEWPSAILYIDSLSRLGHKVRGYCGSKDMKTFLAHKKKEGGK